MWPFRNKYDAFISHAVEDKLPVANDLCERLEKAGLKIWYSGKELTVGDSLEKAIHKGLDQSKFGVVILSPTYLEKNWTRREFYTLLGKEINSRKVILPVLYNITPIDLALHDLTMADRYGLSLDRGMDTVVQKLVAVIKSERSNELRTKLRITGLLTMLLVAVFYFAWNSSISSDSSSGIAKGLIEKRIADLQQDFDQQFQAGMQKMHFSPVQSDSVMWHYNAFRNFQSYYRNEYEFTNGIDNVRFKKNVEPALNIDLDALSPANSYQLSSPQIYLSTFAATKNNKVILYVYVNTQPVVYTITHETKIADDEYLVRVSFTNNVRYWVVSLQYPSGPGMPKRCQTQIQGLLPFEEFKIIKKGPGWTLATTGF